MSFFWDLAYIFSAFVVGLLFEEFLLAPILEPILKYRYHYFLKTAGKLIHNTPIEISITSKSNDLSSLKISPDDLTSIIDKTLREKNGAITIRKPTRIEIQSIKYGDSFSASGAIELALQPRGNELLATGFQITLEISSKYRKFTEYILELSKCIEMVKDSCNLALAKTLAFNEFLSCKLNHMYEIAGVLSSLNAEFIKLGGEIDLIIGKNEVTVAKLPYSEPAIDKLRKLVTLYA